MISKVRLLLEMTGPDGRVSTIEVPFLAVEAQDQMRFSIEEEEPEISTHELLRPPPRPDTYLNFSIHRVLMVPTGDKGYLYTVTHPQDHEEISHS